WLCRGSDRWFDTPGGCDRPLDRSTFPWLRWKVARFAPIAVRYNLSSRGGHRGAPRVPARATVASIPGDRADGYRPRALGRQVHSRFSCKYPTRAEFKARGLTNSIYATDDTARVLPEHRHHGAHRCREDHDH